MYASAQNTGRGEDTLHASGTGAGRGRIDMNRDQFYGTWKQFSGKVKEQWGALADDPHAIAAGTREQLAGRVQEQRGISKREADRQLEEFMNRNRDWWDLSGR